MGELRRRSLLPQNLSAAYRASLNSWTLTELRNLQGRFTAHATEHRGSLR